MERMKGVKTGISQYSLSTGSVRRLTSLAIEFGTVESLDNLLDTLLRTVHLKVTP